jgi:hypothetical protein
MMRSQKARPDIQLTSAASNSGNVSHADEELYSTVRFDDEGWFRKHYGRLGARSKLRADKV